MTTSESHSSGQVTATGPLTVSAVNPRYFTAAGASGRQKAIYLTGAPLEQPARRDGSWCRLRRDPERLDYDAYLDFLVDHGHNFIRLWRWEQFGQAAAGGSTCA